MRIGLPSLTVINATSCARRAAGVFKSVVDIGNDRLP
jgi:hypothetical protein